MWVHAEQLTQSGPEVWVHVEQLGLWALGPEWVLWGAAAALVPGCWTNSSFWQEAHPVWGIQGGYGYWLLQRWKLPVSSVKGTGDHTSEHYIQGSLWLSWGLLRSSVFARVPLSLAGHGDCVHLMADNSFLFLAISRSPSFADIPRDLFYVVICHHFATQCCCRFLIALFSPPRALFMHA